MAMEAIYPKKQVPFNVQMQRSTGNYGSQGKLQVFILTQCTDNLSGPGPQHYRMKSDFDKQKFMKNMSGTDGNYLTLD